MVRFENGERVKFKSPEYLKVAKILANCSPLTFWESMKGGKVDVELQESVPEEFRPQFEPIAETLERQYLMVREQVKDENEYLDPQEFPKMLGLKVQDKSLRLEHREALFSYYRNNEKALDKYVMKYIRPDGNELK